MFELDVGMDMGWIATLVSPVEPAAQLSVFERDAEEDRRPFVSVEVADVDAAHARVLERGYEVVYSPAGRVVNVLSHAKT